MSAEQNRKKRVVWQDVVPASQVIHTPPKRPRKKLISAKLLVFKKVSKKLLATKPRRLNILTLILLVIIGILLMTRFSLPQQQTNTPQSIPQQQNTNLVPGKPTYAILLPTGKTIQNLGGGWVRDQSHPLFVYIDKIGTTQINVSEQPLTDDLQIDTQKEVESIAKAYNLTEKITVGTTIVHVGTFDKGAQRVIFSKTNLLILITSTSYLTNDQWVSYINSLS